jgi:hypothetical protein
LVHLDHLSIHIFEGFVVILLLSEVAHVLLGKYLLLLSSHCV